MEQATANVEAVLTAGTLDQRLEDYLQHLRSLNYSPQTLKKIRNAVKTFIRWLMTQHQVITPDRMQIRHMDAWQQHLFNWRTVKGLPLKPASTNVRIVSVTNFLRYLAGRGYVLKALPGALQPVKLPKTLPTSVLNHAQVRKLFDSIDISNPIGYRNRTMLELLYSSALRACEILSLDLGDVNYEQGTALVHGKGQKDRIVPIGRTALRYLKSYVTAIRPFLTKDQAQTAFFITQWGKRCEYHILKNWIKRYLGNLDLDVPVSTHTFRRSCTTEMIRSGADIYHVKEMLGHESLDTLRHYVRLTITDLKRTHEKCHPRERDERHPED